MHRQSARIDEAVVEAPLNVVHAAVLRGMLCDSIGKSLGLAIVVNLVLLGLGILFGLGIFMCAGGAAVLGAG